MTLKPFQYFDHTADIGMQVFGNSLEALFENASRGMVALIFNQLNREDILFSPQKEHISLTAKSIESLLLKWLQEILFRIEIQKQVFFSFQIEMISLVESRINSYELYGYLYSIPYDNTRHEICMDIKAVTRHQFSVKKIKTGWEANIIFDV